MCLYILFITRELEGAILSLHVNVNVPDFFKEGGGYT